MTDNEIINLLKCCSKSTCSNCGYSKKCDGYSSVNYALDLINRLQEKLATYEARNKALRKERNRLNRQVKELRNIKYIYSTVDYCAEDLQKALEENERLKADITQLTENNILTKYPHCIFCNNGVILTKSIEDYIKLIEGIKKE